MPKRFTFLPEGYKKSTRIRVDGVAATGQISPQGTVQHTDHWDGSMDAIVRPQPIALSVAPSPNGGRPKEQEVRFRMTVTADGDKYVHLRDLEAALHKVDAPNIARRIVVACGERPAQ